MTSDDLIYQFAAGPSGWYAACASGLYRSVDRGAAWQPAYTSLGATGALTTLCVATASGPDQAPFVFAGLSGELLRSGDGGEAWEMLTRPTPAPVFTTLIPSPDFAHDGKLFAGTMEDGVLLYHDYGRSWTLWNFGLLDTNVLCLAVSPAFAHDQMLFVGVQSGLFRSTNGGRSWQEVDLAGSFGAVLCLALSPHFAADGLIYAGIEDGGLLRSADRGRSWHPVGVGSLTESVNGILLDEQFPTQPDLLIQHGETLLASTDGGDSWTAWHAEQLEALEVTAILAPHGLGDDAPVLIGASNGQIRVQQRSSAVNSGTSEQ